MEVNLSLISPGNSSHRKEKKRSMVRARILLPRTNHAPLRKVIPPARS